MLKDSILEEEIPPEILTVAQIAADCTDIDDNARPRMTSSEEEGSSVVKALAKALESLTGAVIEGVLRVVCTGGVTLEVLFPAFRGQI